MHGPTCIFWAKLTPFALKCRYEGWIMPTVYQGHYNPLHREVEAELVPCLRTLNMRLQCFSPILAGLLGDADPHAGVPRALRGDRSHSQLEMHSRVFEIISSGG
jgi:aryl-alcohol dehydrogenase-like predicted oxidoreductase